MCTSITCNLSLVPNIRAPVRQRLYVYHLCEVMGSEVWSKVLEVGDFDVYMAAVEGESDCDMLS